MKRWNIFRLEFAWLCEDFIRVIQFPFIFSKNLWNSLWIRKDEFHSSLDIDFEYLGTVGLKSKKGEKYMKDLEERRRIAHERDIERMDK